MCLKNSCTNTSKEQLHKHVQRTVAQMCPKNSCTNVSKEQLHKRVQRTVAQTRPKNSCTNLSKEQSNLKVLQVAQFHNININYVCGPYINDKYDLVPECSTILCIFIMVIVYFTCEIMIFIM